MTSPEPDTTMDRLASIVQDAGPDGPLVVRLWAESDRKRIAMFREISAEGNRTVERVANTMKESVDSLVAELKEDRKLIRDIQAEQSAMREVFASGLKSVGRELQNIREDNRAGGDDGAAVEVVANTLGSAFRNFAIIAVVAVAVIGAVAAAKFGFDAGFISFASGAEAIDTPDSPQETPLDPEAIE